MNIMLFVKNSHQTKNIFQKLSFWEYKINGFFPDGRSDKIPATVFAWERNDKISCYSTVILEQILLTMFYELSAENFLFVYSGLRKDEYCQIPLPIEGRLEVADGDYLHIQTGKELGCFYQEASIVKNENFAQIAHGMICQFHERHIEAINLLCRALACESHKDEIDIALQQELYVCEEVRAYAYMAASCEAKGLLRKDYSAYKRVMETPRVLEYSAIDRMVEVYLE